MRKLQILEMDRLTVDEFKHKKKIPIEIVLDNIRSFNNVGSFFRTADALGIGKIYLCGITPCPPHREITKSALGAELSVDWEQHPDSTVLVNDLKAQGYQILSIEQAEGSTHLQEFIPDPDKKYALVFGNEVEGVMDEIIAVSDYCIEIPQFGTKHSFNVSVSGGIVMWELVKHYF